MNLKVLEVSYKTLFFGFVKALKAVGHNVAIFLWTRGRWDSRHCPLAPEKKQAWTTWLRVKEPVDTENMTWCVYLNTAEIIIIGRQQASP